MFRMPPDFLPVGKRIDLRRRDRASRAGKEFQMAVRADEISSIIRSQIERFGQPVLRGVDETVEAAQQGRRRCVVAATDAAAACHFRRRPDGSGLACWVSALVLYGCVPGHVPRTVTPS